MSRSCCSRASSRASPRANLCVLLWEETNGARANLPRASAGEALHRAASPLSDLAGHINPIPRACLAVRRAGRRSPPP
ncbi:hypothetical protein ZWY2020_058131 [Hordeum vulgare]|nr:hypothetical protein ZWY2020_058131 [Hordeum vulgare]